MIVRDIRLWNNMKRSAKYSLKFLTQKKQDLLNTMFDIYEINLQKTIDLLWDKKIPLKINLSSKSIYWMNDLGGQYKSLIYKHASEIVRSCKFKKGKKTKPQIKNFVINFDQRMVRVEQSKNSFDKWVRLKLPFIKENKKIERIEISIPIKEHKHSLKFQNWKLCNSVKLSKTAIIFTFEKETPKVKENGETIGIDQGYKKLLVTSENQRIGSDFEKYYEKIARKSQGSKAFKRALIERNNKINELINKELDLSTLKEIVIEDLKGIKQGTKGKIRKKFNNRLQRWCYAKCVNKLDMLCEEEAVLLTRRPPAYTSQRCNLCGFIHKNNRKGEKFLCLNCGNEMDADWNASINLSQMGVYSPHSFSQFH